MTTNPHDEIISAMLMELNPVGGEIRLLGRVQDPIIGNTSDNEVFFLIPDLHLISPARQEHFGKYGFNHAESGILAKLLQKMAALQQLWEADNSHTLIAIQLGDFFDMWREFPGGAKPEEIEDDTYGDLRDVLYRGQFRGKPCLKKTTMLLGNHDTKSGMSLKEIKFQLKAFNETQNEKPFLFVTHGDAFDIIERITPDALQEFVVYFLAKPSEEKYKVGNWGEYAGKINKQLPDLETAITGPEHSLNKIVAGAPKVVSGQPLPSVLCHEIDTADKTEHKRFKPIYLALDAAAKKKLLGQHVRVAAIGHTHEASMILCRPKDGGRPLLLMDVGAWIEKCTYSLAEGGKVTEPSAQLGVIHGNDARIYQIRIPAKG